MVIDEIYNDYRSLAHRINMKELELKGFKRKWFNTITKKKYSIKISKSLDEIIDSNAMITSNILFNLSALISAENDYTDNKNLKINDYITDSILMKSIGNDDVEYNYFITNISVPFENDIVSVRAISKHNSFNIVFKLKEKELSKYYKYYDFNFTDSLELNKEDRRVNDFLSEYNKAILIIMKHYVLSMIL